MASRRIIPISHRKLVKVFELEGFVVKRQKGDHLILTKPGIKRPVVIKTSPKEVPITHIVTNLRTAGISRERYFEPLTKYVKAHKHRGSTTPVHQAGTCKPSHKPT